MSAIEGFTRAVLLQPSHCDHCKVELKAEADVLIVRSMVDGVYKTLATICPACYAAKSQSADANEIDMRRLREFIIDNHEPLEFAIGELYVDVAIRNLERLLIMIKERE